MHLSSLALISILYIFGLAPVTTSTALRPDACPSTHGGPAGPGCSQPRPVQHAHRRQFRAGIQKRQVRNADYKVVVPSASAAAASPSAVPAPAPAPAAATPKPASPPPPPATPSSSKAPALVKRVYTYYEGSNSEGVVRDNKRVPETNQRLGSTDSELDLANLLELADITPEVEADINALLPAGLVEGTIGGLFKGDSGTHKAKADADADNGPALLDLTNLLDPNSKREDEFASAQEAFRPVTVVEKQDYKTASSKYDTDRDQDVVFAYYRNMALKKEYEKKSEKNTA